MKEERMAILNMLEKGIITADEAERLLNALHNGMDLERDGLGSAVGGALKKAGAALSAAAERVKESTTVKNAADKVAEKADDLQPKVRSAAFRMTEKIADTADSLEPAVRSAAFRMTEKASILKEDMAAYRDKLRERRQSDNAEDWDIVDLEQMDAEEAAQATEAVTEAAVAAQEITSQKAQTPTETADEKPDEKTDEQDEQKDETAADIPEQERISPEMNKYLNKVENVLDGMNEQMEQLNDMEAFLKSSFGDLDPSEWEDDEEEEKH